MLPQRSALLPSVQPLLSLPTPPPKSHSFSTSSIELPDPSVSFKTFEELEDFGTSFLMQLKGGATLPEPVGSSITHAGLSNSSQPQQLPIESATRSISLPSISGGNPSRPFFPDTRICQFCGVFDTPMWRRGPAGRGTLCNACGIRWSQKNKASSTAPSVPSAAAPASATSASPCPVPTALIPKSAQPHRGSLNLILPQPMLPSPGHGSFDYADSKRRRTSHSFDLQADAPGLFEGFTKSNRPLPHAVHSRSSTSSSSSSSSDTSLSSSDSDSSDSLSDGPSKSRSHSRKKSPRHKQSKYKSSQKRSRSSQLSLFPAAPLLAPLADLGRPRPLNLPQPGRGAAPLLASPAPSLSATSSPTLAASTGSAQLASFSSPTRHAEQAEPLPFKHLLQSLQAQLLARSSSTPSLHSVSQLQAALLDIALELESFRDEKDPQVSPNFILALDAKISTLLHNFKSSLPNHD